MFDFIPDRHRLNARVLAFCARHVRSWLRNFMEKRYQVFVSSTFSDLKDERQGIMQTLMQLDCIPAGMELFPAADEE